MCSDLDPQPIMSLCWPPRGYQTRYVVNADVTTELMTRANIWVDTKSEYLPTNSMNMLAKISSSPTAQTSAEPTSHPHPQACNP
jgi:hypothetical protein